MANPILSPIDGDDAANVCYVNGKYTVGASGALTAVTNKNKGITSITRNSAGSYTVILSAGTFPGGLLRATIGLIGAYTTAGGTVGQVTVDSSAASTHLITFVMYAVGTQTATDPANGTTLFFEFKLQNGVC